METDSTGGFAMRKCFLAVLTGAAALFCACSTFDSPETEAAFRSIRFFGEGDPIRTLSYTAKYEEKGRAPITCEVLADQDGGKILRVYSDGQRKYRYLVVGSRGWVEEPNGKIVPMRDEVVRIIRLTAYSLLEPYSVIDSVSAGKEPDSFVLNLKHRVRSGILEGAVLTVDPKTKLPASLSSRMANGADMIAEFSDYRKAGSVDFPHKIAIRQNNVETVCTISDLVVNPEIPDSAFVLQGPENSASQPQQQQQPPQQQQQQQQ